MGNCKFLGGGPPGIATVAAGQNCGQGGGAGPCNVHYLFENVDFSRMRANQKLIKFGAHTSGGQAAVQSMFVARDNSLGGYRSIVSGHLNGFQQAGCVQLGWEWEDALGCDRLVRRFNVWGPDSGQIKLSGTGYQVGENWAFPSEGRNAGFLSWDRYHGSYGASMLVGESYSLSGNFNSDMIVEFSDAALGSYFGTDEAIQLDVGGQSCELRSSDDRSFICPMGRDGGTWGGCPHIVFDRHSVIRGGRLECGDPTAARPPVPVPTPSPTPSPRPTPAPTPTPLLPEGSCSSFDAWPDVDVITCNGCTALVLTAPYGGRCDTYCESFGHVCVAAAEEDNENCQVKYTVGCDVEVASTTDMLCTCRLPDATTSTDAPSSTPADAPSSTPSSEQSCASFDQWPNVDTVTCDSCTALVLTGPYSGRCDLYCESFGHVCIAAAEEENENCEVKFNVACDEDVTEASGTLTSDMLCTCRMPDFTSSTSTAASSTTSSTSSLTTLTTSQSTGSTTGMQMSFEPVDGGEGRACRGASPTDNSADHFSVFFGIPKMEGCMAKCESEPLCTGIEHNPSGRCEVWTRPEGIQASVPVAGYTCLAYVSAVTSTSTAISTTETTSLQISSSTITTSLTASTSAAGSLTWTFYQHTNCYTGAGATSSGSCLGR